MRRRPSPATVIACVALFFSLGGGIALATTGGSDYSVSADGLTPPNQPWQDSTSQYATASCHQGDQAVTGGYSIARGAVVTYSEAVVQDGVPVGWLVGARGVPGTTVPGSFTAWVLCS